MTSVSADQVPTRLEAERIVRLSREEWEAVAPAFAVLERHATGVAGDLLIVRGPSSLAAVEEPSSGERVIRRLPDEAAARLFVQERLAQYERMWDGCGCKVDYYG